jgi:hypothetical protein
MHQEGRTLRSATAKHLACQEVEPATIHSNITELPKDPSTISIVPPGRNLSGLDVNELKLLREKQARLRSSAKATLHSLPGDPEHLRRALRATLIFSQYEAGTAVCVEPLWVLTCAHCFGDTYEEYLESDKRKWLLSYDGQAVLAQCRFWDGQRDLALLEIVAVEAGCDEGTSPPLFPTLPISNEPPRARERLLCIGQPGRDDLESTSARKTKYNIIEVSEGKYRGMVQGVDPQNNTEIGTLKHDCASTPLDRCEDTA